MAFLDETGLTELWRLICKKHDGFVNEHIWSKTSKATKDVLKHDTAQTMVTVMMVEENYATTNSWPVGSTSLTCELVNGAVVLGEISYPGLVTDETKAGVGYYYQTSGQVYYLEQYQRIDNGNPTYYARKVVVETLDAGELVGYVNSPDINAYPPSEDDGYTYEYLGQMGDKIRMETGSYVGNGKYGYENPNTLQFDFEPTMVFISGETTAYKTICVMMQPWSICFANDRVLGSMSGVTWGKTISWYAGSEHEQSNGNTRTYKYVAIGR